MNKIVKKPSGNSTFVIGGDSCSAESLLAGKGFLFRINFFAKNSLLRQSSRRYGAPPSQYTDIH